MKINPLVRLNFFICLLDSFLYLDNLDQLNFALIQEKKNGCSTFNDINALGEGESQVLHILTQIHISIDSIILIFLYSDLLN